jgi:hypothetical protein
MGSGLTAESAGPRRIYPAYTLPARVRAQCPRDIADRGQVRTSDADFQKLWAPRVGSAATRALRHAYRWGRAMRTIGLLAAALIVVGLLPGADLLRFAGVAGWFVVALMSVAAGPMGRRASRLVRDALGIDLHDNRMAPGELPPTEPVAYASWLQRMRSAPDAPYEPPQQFGDPPKWSPPAGRFLMVTSSCFHCLRRLRPHNACGAKDCFCATRDHPGLLGSRR